MPSFHQTPLSQFSQPPQKLQNRLSQSTQQQPQQQQQQRLPRTNSQEPKSSAEENNRGAGLDMNSLQKSFVSGLKQALNETQPTVGEVYQSDETQSIMNNFKLHAQRQEELVNSEWEKVQ